MPARSSASSISQRDHVHRRAAGIGRRDRDLDAAVEDATSRSTPRSAMVSTGISGSTTVAAASQARCRRSASLRERGHHVAPGKVALHRYCSSAQQMAEMLAVPAAAAALLHPAVVGQGQRRLARPRRTPSSSHAARSARRIDGDAGLDQVALAGVGVEQLAGEGPEVVERRLRAAWLSSVPSPSRIDPFRRHGAGDRRFPSRPWPRSPPASRRASASSRANRDRRRPSRTIAAPWCARNRRSAARPAADCGTAVTSRR